MKATMFSASVNSCSFMVASVVTMALVLGSTASRASDLSDIKSKGGRQLTQKQVAEMYIGRKIRAQSLDDQTLLPLAGKHNGAGLTSLLDDEFPAVETEPAALLLGTVALDAEFLKDRLDILDVVDLGLGGQIARPNKRQQQEERALWHGVNYR